MLKHITKLLPIVAILSLGACSSTGGFHGATDWMGLTSQEERISDANANVEVTKEHLEYVNSVAEYFNGALASAESNEKREPRAAHEMDVQISKLNVKKAKVNPESDLGKLYNAYQTALQTEKTNAAQKAYMHPALDMLNANVELAKNVVREANKAHNTASATYASLTKTPAKREARQNAQKGGKTMQNVGTTAAALAGLKIPGTK